MRCLREMRIVMLICVMVDIFFEKCKMLNICFDIESELLEDEYICELEDDIFGLEEEDLDVV